MCYLPHQNTTRRGANGLPGRHDNYNVCLKYSYRTTGTASSSWAREATGAEKKRAAAAPARGRRRRASRAASLDPQSRRAGRGGAGRAARRRRLPPTEYCLCWLMTCLLYRRAVRRFRTDLRRRTSAELTLLRHLRFRGSASQARRSPVIARCTDATHSVIWRRSCARNCLPCAVQLPSKASVSIR